MINNETFSNELEVKNYTREEVEKIMKKEKLTMHQFLQRIQKQGYLLHGSPNGKIEEFEPKVPGDRKGGWTTQKGVYATSTTQPILFSIIHRDKVRGPCHFEISRGEDAITYRISQNIKDSEAIQPGWIYIFENTGFTPNPNGSGEWINPNSVKPIGKVPTNPSDLENPIIVVDVPAKGQDR